MASFFASCGGTFNDEPLVDDPGQVLPVAMQPDTVRLLAIGNSYTMDALALLPFVLRQVSPRTHVVVGILYTGGVAMDYHLHSYRKNSAYNTYFKWTPESGVWYRESFSKPLQALADEHWDFVTMQQVSQLSHDFTTISPYLQPLVDVLRESGYTGRVGWLLTPAYPDGSPRLTNGTLKRDGQPVTCTSDEMFAAIAACAQQVMQTGCPDFVLPCGTALQNARHTSLSQYGDWGQLTNDGLHLQSGIPMFVEACAAAMVLLNTTFEKCYLNVDSSQYQGLGHGKQVGMTATNQNLAVKCANQAFLSPFALSRW